jgi:transcriptional regulator with PAS, ATPase and Fis domain
VAAVRDLSRQKAMEIEREQLQRENLTLKTTIRDRYKFGNIIGKSLVMQQVYEAIVQAAACDDAVIIYGESGTGKELAAQTIHRLSARHDRAFIPVNCGAIVETLFEREFFGHCKGAFTGADATQPGYFEAAHQGSLFLDEVGELPPFMQVKLLRALEYGEYTPVGSTTSQKADVRIITATNKNLDDLRNNGLLREDFFYRIHIIPIRIPPLRERKEDIPLLVEHFLNQYSQDSHHVHLPVQIFQAFYDHEWSGNVRELQNTLKRYLATKRLDFIGSGHDRPSENGVLSGPEIFSEDLQLNEALEAFEKHVLTCTLNQYQWNKTKAATHLGISRQSLLRRIEKYELQPDDL